MRDTNKVLFDIDAFLMMMLRRLWRHPRFLVTFAFVCGLSILVWLNVALSHQEDRIHQLQRQERVAQLKSHINILKGDNSTHAIKSTKKKIPKVFIYPLPPKFNYDIENCISPSIHRNGRLFSCFNLSNNGFGDFMYEKGDMRVHNTNQFSLEVVMHHQLAHSRYRTYDADEADVFYIPSYLGVMFFCKRLSMNVSSMTTELFDMLNTWPYLKRGKPHFAALAKIEREQCSNRYPYLKNPHCRNVTYLGIEKEATVSWRSQVGIQNQRLIVVPYPSYVHRNTLYTYSQAINSPGLDQRKVFLLLASSTRRSNGFRAILIDQFTNKIRDVSKAKYLKKCYNTS
ncbi:probable xyloglucan galactosyltransferase GT17 isoform X2 [Haliotis rubra]|uniref:probable xyloglucan galactosyltransferase GT17 isoform X2 n=1 Tax=Haliotis rubra TaxID=36100 RepID=UPI001EE57C9F|nr:probable xyloglucan galactosyltransferase GT17 isoform X2 [Haliotis rubra]XP_046568929.1 probable xyloglucan galactosyltransferase GT17 isoform X2 [Haliotis rubra]